MSATECLNLNNPLVLDRFAALEEPVEIGVPPRLFTLSIASRHELVTREKVLAQRVKINRYSPMSVSDGLP